MKSRRSAPPPLLLTTIAFRTLNISRRPSWKPSVQLFQLRSSTERCRHRSTDMTGAFCMELGLAQGNRGLPGFRLVRLFISTAVASLLSPFSSLIISWHTSHRISTFLLHMVCVRSSPCFRDLTSDGSTGLHLFFWPLQLIFVQESASRSSWSPDCMLVSTFVKI